MLILLKSNRISLVLVGIILALSLIIRLSFVLTVHTLPESDMQGYDERGVLFMEHQSFHYGENDNGSDLPIDLLCIHYS
jgi:hypothetical protein